MNPSDLTASRSRCLYSYCESPLGPLLLTSDGAALTGLHMPQHNDNTPPPPQPGWVRDDPALRAARDQLRAYFAGELRVFDLPLRIDGTAFQRLVWEELTRIPFGVTISYAEQARRMGYPGAARAVGAANGRNPIGIVVPCHRVIGADGTLTGYGGGLDRKRWLLEHEASALGAVRRTRGRQRKFAFSVASQ
jgi:methylated-DNA-[protein]-cysteine S-methyltransferase